LGKRDNDPLATNKYAKDVIFLLLRGVKLCLNVSFVKDVAMYCTKVRN
jgi:hypothetical protein